ncbi:MAG: hypothetical protein EOP32_12015 [Rhodococcus sp. (in: high G+C Gram-positive bacteria)]|nr:MAG: hypothetical protein EOP32_12015 [Rhodococcus sp. (in: high G+C Gram-positive bacteria)]
MGTQNSSKTGNPIRYHGEYHTGEKLYIPMPMAMHKDKSVSPEAYRVFGAIFSNVEGWEVSTNSLMAECGMTKRAAIKAMDNLILNRWVAREAMGWNRYTMHVARVTAFSKEEHASLNTYVSSTRKPVVQNRHKGASGIPTPSGPKTAPMEQPQAIPTVAAEASQNPAPVNRITVNAAVEDQALIRASRRLYDEGIDDYEILRNLVSEYGDSESRTIEEWIRVLNEMMETAAA